MSYLETVEFSCIYPDAKPGEYGSAEDPSPYLGVEKSEMERSLAQMVDGDEVVAPSDFFVRYDYPLSRPVDFKFELEGPVTRRAFARALSSGYQRIYAEEEETQTYAPRTMEEKERSAMGDDGVIPDGRMILINRDDTDGKYGIWGHDIGDLLINHAQRIGVITVNDVKLPLYALSVDS